MLHSLRLHRAASVKRLTGAKNSMYYRESVADVHCVCVAEATEKSKSGEGGGERERGRERKGASKELVGAVVSNARRFLVLRTQMAPNHGSWLRPSACSRGFQG